MGAHKGRCFRQWRRTKARKEAQAKARKEVQGGSWGLPIRQKVPLALRPFLTGDDRQTRAGADAMSLAITRYAQHQTMLGNVGRHAARGR